MRGLKVKKTILGQMKREGEREEAGVGEKDF